MMKVRKTCTLFICLMIVCSLLVQVSAECPEATVDGPTELFISLYTELMNGTVSYSLQCNGVPVTDAFAAKHREEYEKGDFQPIWEDVLENGYILEYGEAETVPVESAAAVSSSASYTAYSSWAYTLQSLDSLLKGKTVEYVYRLKGIYTVSDSAIISYTQPVIEVNMTFPGTLFPYVLHYDTRSASCSSSGAYLLFTVRFHYTFTYTWTGASQDTTTLLSYTTVTP